MNGVLPVERTVLLKLQLFLGIAAVFAGGVVFPLAFGALERYQFNDLLLTGHILTP